MTKKKVFATLLCVMMVISSSSVMAKTTSKSFGTGATAKLTTASDKSCAQAWTTGSSTLDKSTGVKIVDVYGYTNGWSYGETYAYAGSTGLTNPETAYSSHVCGSSSVSLNCNFT